MAGNAVLRAARLEAENLRLAQTIAPRRLSDDTFSDPSSIELMKPLRGKDIFIISYAQDPEAAAFAYQIKAIVENAEIEVANAILRTPPQGSLIVGIHLAGSDKDAISCVETLLHHLKLEYIVDDQMIKDINPNLVLREGETVMFIGAKPLPAWSPTK